MDAATGYCQAYNRNVLEFLTMDFLIMSPSYRTEGRSWGAAIIDEVLPQPGDTVIDKSSHDCFFNTDMNKTLNRLVSDPTCCQAIITGGAINVCVYHAAMGFYLRDYWTLVVTDCCFYGTATARDTAISQFSLGAYPNIFLTRSDLVNVFPVPVPGRPSLVPGT